ATTTLTARDELGPIITTAAPGELTIYFHDTPNADFTDPASFTQGQPIAVFALRYRNILVVQAPDEGLSTALADLEQRSAEAFTLEGRQHHLGHQGLQARIEATGQGIRTSRDPLRAFFLLGGSTTVTGH